MTANESTSTARDRAHNVAGKVVDKVQETASRIVGGGQGAGQSTGGQSPPVMEQAADQVTSRLDTGKEYVVEAVTGVAQALRQTGQHLRQEGAQPKLAQYAERGAEQIESFGGYLRRRDTGQLIGDLEGFARRQPMVFASSAFALGMLAVRFLRAESTPQRQSFSSPTSGTYGSSSYGTSYSGTAPMTGRTGTGTTPGSPSAQPGAFTAAQPGSGGAPSARPTPSSGGGPGTGAGTRTTSVPPTSGAGAGSGTGTGAPGAQSDRPTPRPTSSPSLGSTPTGSTPPTPRPGSGTPSSGGTSTPGGTGTGGRSES